MAPVHLWYGDGADSPRTTPEEVLRAADVVAATAVDVTLGWTVERHAWVDEPSFHARTVMAGCGLADAVAEGLVRPDPSERRRTRGLLRRRPDAVTPPLHGGLDGTPNHLSHLSISGRTDA